MQDTSDLEAIYTESNRPQGFYLFSNNNSVFGKWAVENWFSAVYKIPMIE